MIIIVPFFISSISHLLLLVFMSKLLQPRFNAWKTAAMAVIIGIFSILKALSDAQVFVILSAIAVLLVLCIPFFMYRGKVWKRLIVFLYFLGLLALSETSAFSLFLVLFDTTIMELLSNKLSPSTLIASAGTIPIYLLLGSLSLSVWNRISAKRFQFFYLLFFILPIGQLIIMFSYFHSLGMEWWLFGIFVSLTGTLIMFCYIMAHEKSDMLEASLHETRRRMELEQAHYQELEHRHDEFAKIRHDFNNQLASIEQLVRIGENAAARDMIDALMGEINQTEDR